VRQGVVFAQHVFGSLPGLSGPDLKGEVRTEDSTASLVGLAEGPSGVHCGPTSKAGVLMNEWVIVGIVALIVFLFGARKLPDLARSLGKSSSEFKKGMSEGASDSEQAGTSDETEQRSEGKAPTSE
jgi:sec-independent protein translocase protein TatA